MAIKYFFDGLIISLEKLTKFSLVFQKSLSNNLEKKKKCNHVTAFYFGIGEKKGVSVHATLALPPAQFRLCIERGRLQLSVIYGF